MSEHDKILPLVQSSSQGMVSNELLRPMLPEETLWEKVLHPISPVLRGESSHSVISVLGTINPSDTAAHGRGLCPREHKDNAAVPPGVTGSASRPARPRTAALSSGRVPPPEQTPPRFIWGAAFWALTPQIPGEVWEIISLCLSELSNLRFSSAHHRLPSVPLQITQAEAEDQNLHIQAVTWGQDNPFPRAGRVQGPFF